jgi:glycosyltransferase involved in cell wall biosynthesis
MNRFVFIVPFRNVKSFILQCYTSLLTQNNSNWIAIFCDDASEDGTIELLPSDCRFIIRKNTNRITALPNIHNAIIESGLEEEDIICILDGDDYLIRNDAIDIIDNLYQDNTLLTYGQYVWLNGYSGHCQVYTEDTFKILRKSGYLASHLRTFRYKLYKEIIVQDPNLDCYKDNNNNFYKSCYDVAIMTPLMEIAGLNNIKFNPIPVYYYRTHPQNDHIVDGQLQRKIADEVFSKTPFKKTIF